MDLKLLAKRSKLHTACYCFFLAHVEGRLDGRATAILQPRWHGTAYKMHELIKLLCFVLG